MKLAIDIVQSLLLPKLEKDASFDINQTNIAFWETFTTAFFDFKKDPKPVYTAIYSLGLKDAEIIISKLDTVYNSFIKALAENHVLRINSEAIDYLIKSKNSTFEKEVNFFTDLQNAIKKVERKRIKEELPKSFDRIIFEITQDEMESVIRKKEREYLKENMKTWDKEISLSDNTPVYSISNNKTIRVISSSFIKYAASVCINLSVSVQYFNFEAQYNFIPKDDKNVITTKIKEEPITTEIPLETLAEVATVSKKANVIESGLGYVSKKNNIKIVEKNQKYRMVSIVTAIEKYQKLLENEFSENKVGDIVKGKALESKISELQNELALLKERENYYIFDGKALVLYVSNFANENSIVLYETTYYLKKGAEYFKLTVSEQPQLYEKESNTEVISTLDKIIFDYGN